MPKKTKQRKTCLYEFDKELAGAFKFDCTSFLEDYEKLQSLTFSDFAKIWQLKNFTYVYAEQNFALLLKEFCENCFYIIKKYIIFPKSIFTQVGAFYMLYGLYYKQPLRNWVKIRLTLEEYQKIVELMEELKKKNELDAVYIFAKMKIDQAFLYVAARKPLGPEDRFVKSFELYYNDTFNSYTTESALSSFNALLPDSKLVVDLQKTNTEYQHLLQKYSEKCSSLTPFKSTIVDDLYEAYNKISGPSTSKELKEELDKNDIQNKRKSIKNRAMANKNAVYRAARKTKPSVDAMDVDYSLSSESSDN